VFGFSVNQRQACLCYLCSTSLPMAMHTLDTPSLPSYRAQGVAGTQFLQGVQVQELSDAEWAGCLCHGRRNLGHPRRLFFYIRRWVVDPLCSRSPPVFPFRLSLPAPANVYTHMDLTSLPAGHVAQAGC
jgi:hypothetical protein